MFIRSIVDDKIRTDCQQNNGDRLKTRWYSKSWERTNPNDDANKRKQCVCSGEFAAHLLSYKSVHHRSWYKDLRGLHLVHFKVTDRVPRSADRQNRTSFSLVFLVQLRIVMLIIVAKFNYFELIYGKLFIIEISFINCTKHRIDDTSSSKLSQSSSLWFAFIHYVCESETPARSDNAHGDPNTFSTVHDEFRNNRYVHR